MPLGPFSNSSIENNQRSESIRHEISHEIADEKGPPAADLKVQTASKNIFIRLLQRSYHKFAFILKKIKNRLFASSTEPTNDSSLAVQKVAQASLPLKEERSSAKIKAAGKATFAFGDSSEDRLNSASSIGSLISGLSDVKGGDVSLSPDLDAHNTNAPNPDALNERKRLALEELALSLAEEDEVIPLPLLCKTVNMCQRNVIETGEDALRGEEFRAQLLDPQYYVDNDLPWPRPQILANLAQTPIEGALVTGVCSGACLLAIGDLMRGKVSSEEELIAYFQSFQAGFPKEAGALQEVGMLFQPNEIAEEEMAMIEAKLAANKSRLQEEVNREINSSHGGSFSHSTSSATDSEQQMQDKRDARNAAKVIFAKKERALEKELICSLFIQKMLPIASLAGLTLKAEDRKDYSGEKAIFTSFFSSLQAQSTFNQLGLGYYEVRFQLDANNAHSIAYMNTEFGTYLFDPDYGLIRCSANPAETLCQLQQAIYPEAKQAADEFFMSVLQFDLLPSCSS